MTLRTASSVLRRWCLFSVFLLPHLRNSTAKADLVLSEHIMNLTVEAARLSMLAYEETEPDDTITKDYEAFGYYDDEPDQALTVKTSDGHCYVAFRGTSLTFDDWGQNIQIGMKELCIDIAGSTECCTSRVGFFDAYDTIYRKDVEDRVRKCASQCKDKDDCVVITGHSQGGAIAAVAAVFLADLNPYVITFGQPPTIDAPCVVLTSDRIFRFVNTKQTNTGVAYDPVPMAPGLGADHFGNMIVLGDDPTGIAFIGLDARDFLQPFLNGIEAHFMQGNGTYPGYNDRIVALTAPNATYPIRSNGFVPGSLCSVNKECETNECGKELLTSWKRCIGIDCEVDDDCETDRCDSGVCLPKATSCMDCDEDSDCAGETTMCLFYKCSNEFGLMDNNCVCRTGSDCSSGRCEGNFPYAMCQARLADGGSCNENSDCKSGLCSWEFVCARATNTNKFLNALFWIVIALFLLAVLYSVYFCFCKRGRDGYTRVSGNEDNKKSLTSYSVVIGVTAASVAIAAAIWFIASGKAPTPNVFKDTSTSQQDMSLSYGMKEYTMEKTQMEEAATSPFFKVLPWRLTSERQSSGVLEFCSDGNETYGYGSLGDCIPGQPSPLIRMKPQHHYQLTLVNNAHIDTNLHTHGLHVSGVGSVDDVTRNAKPGECLVYEYYVLDDADVGTFWYHPHRHPLVTKEAFGGGYGMLLVDEISEDYYPLHLENFLKNNEVLLQFGSMYNKLLSSIRHNRVNGLRKLNLVLSGDVFYYFRISSVVYAESVNWVEFYPPDACMSQPVAYDGVYRSEIPHPNSTHKHMLSVSSRLDLAVRCQSDVDIYFHQGGNLTEKAHMVHIHVSDLPCNDPLDENSTFLDGPIVSLTPSLPSSPYWNIEQETSWEPRRPYYMPDLLSSQRRVEDKWILSMDDYFKNGTKGFSINEVTWDPKKAIRKYDLGQLVEWNLVNTQTHPYHAHINRMLIVEPGGCGHGRFEEGQYYDTIAADQDECRVRVKFFDFAGRIVIHCHRFGHEDMGMMSWIDVLGGSGHGMHGQAQVDCSAALMKDRSSRRRWREA